MSSHIFACWYERIQQILPYWRQRFMEDIHGETHGGIAPAPAVAPDIRAPVVRPGISSPQPDPIYSRRWTRKIRQLEFASWAKCGRNWFFLTIFSSNTGMIHSYGNRTHNETGRLTNRDQLPVVFCNPNLSYLRFCPPNTPFVARLVLSWV